MDIVFYFYFFPLTRPLTYTSIDSFRSIPSAVINTNGIVEQAVSLGNPDSQHQ